MGSVIKPSKPAPAPAPKPVATQVAPTTAEVSQVTDTATDSYDLRKEKRKGRSPTIITSATGVSGGLTLGSPSLLGR